MSVKYKIVKKFTKGNLAGLTHESEISFVSDSMARKWRNGVMLNQKLGHLNYELIWFGKVEPHHMTIEEKWEQDSNSITFTIPEMA